jgi:small conductance mechanosensitive channel
MFNELEKLGLSQEELMNALWAYVPNIFAGLVVGVFFIMFYMVTSRLLRSALSRTAMQPSLVEVTVNSLYKWAIMIIAIISFLSQLGINVTAALAGVGVVGIAIGFAAKETLANILSGFSIFIDKLYRKGDWVTIAGKYGQVKSITLRTTKIRTLDNIFVIVPNSAITGEPVTNYSEEGMVRISAKVGIAYGESIDKAREVLLVAAGSIDGVRSDPSPAVVVDELADSSVNLLVRLWVDDAGSDPFYRFTLTEVCKKALDEAGITIPFPQRDVHLNTTK